MIQKVASMVSDGARGGVAMVQVGALLHVYWQESGRAMRMSVRVAASSGFIVVPLGLSYSIVGRRRRTVRGRFVGW